MVFLIDEHFGNIIEYINMLRSKTEKNKNQIKVLISPKIYPLESVYGAAYVFLDRAYIRLDGDPQKKIIIQIKSKKKINKKGLENLADAFLNELLNYGLRYQISKKNKKIREYIVGTALLSAPGESVEEKGKEKEKEDWQKDTLGIAIPWEEKYGKK